jgi:hypothetical protein
VIVTTPDYDEIMRQTGTDPLNRIYMYRTEPPLLASWARDRILLVLRAPMEGNAYGPDWIPQWTPQKWEHPREEMRAAAPLNPLGRHVLYGWDFRVFDGHADWNFYAGERLAGTIRRLFPEYIKG